MQLLPISALLSLAANACFAEELTVTATPLSSESALYQHIREDERHAEIALSSEFPVGVISLYDHGLLYGETTQLKTSWQVLTVRKADGEKWVKGAVDVFKMSPDGSRVVLVEEHGRFAILVRDHDTITATSHQSPYFVRLAPDTNFLQGLDINSVSWCDNRFVAIGYENGRVDEFDVTHLKTRRTLRKGSWKSVEVTLKDDRDKSVVNSDKENLYVETIFTSRRDESVFLLKRQLSVYESGVPRGLQRQAWAAISTSPTELLVVLAKNRFETVNLPDLTMNSRWTLPSSPTFDPGGFRCVQKSKNEDIQMVMKLYPGFALVKLSQDGTSQVRKLSPEFFSADSLRRASDVVLTADGLKLRYICFPQLRESLIEDALFEN